MPEELVHPSANYSTRRTMTYSVQRIGKRMGANTVSGDGGRVVHRFMRLKCAKVVESPLLSTK